MKGIRHTRFVGFEQRRWVPFSQTLPGFLGFHKTRDISSTDTVLKVFVNKSTPLHKSGQLRPHVQIPLFVKEGRHLFTVQRNSGNRYKY